MSTLNTYESDMTKANCITRMGAGGVTLILALMVSGPAVATTCSAEIPGLKAEIEAMESNADKNIAEHQLQRAEERLAAGKEKSCLRYVGAARAAIEAWQMHDD